MKSLIAAASAAALCAAIPALAQAQNFSPVTTYGTLGYTNSHVDGGVDLGAIQGRLGARFGNYVGVEGELAGGVKSDDADVGGTSVNVKLRHQEAIYGVAFLPVTPKADLFARVGYGSSNIRASGSGSSFTGSQDSWNYGVGGQYFLTPKDGVRVDYTRHDFNGGGDLKSDEWGVSYVRKF
jgi:outer membrane immunogenic protein